MNASSNSNCLSPFNIKRKCLASLTNSSPSYSISSVNLAANNSTPIHLNDSFDENISCNKRYMSSSIKRTSRIKSGTLFTRYKSAPLTTDFISGQQQQPLNDISNLLQKQTHEDQEMSDVNDLENLIYGNLELNQQMIKHSLEIDASCHGLIGDRTKKHILPTIQSSKHQDLHCISPQTLVDVLEGNFNDQIDECVVIDSRYPYEYDAGHIRVAKNIFSKQKLYDEMFFKRYVNETKAKRVIVIFHCEFSSERGPSLLKFLRSQDRLINEPVYPNLYFPELYLLEGGYKLFYLNFKNYCEPQDYKPMLHAEHLNELRHFRAKAKSWSSEITRLKTIFKFSNSSTNSNDSSMITDNLTIGTNQHKIVKMKTFY